MLTALDLRTVTLVASVMAGLMSLVLFSVYRSFPDTIRGLGAWTLGSVVIFVAGGLFVLRGHAPDWLTIVVGNAMVLGGIGLWLMGMQAFHGRKPSWRAFCAVIAGGTAAVSWWLFVHPDYVARLVVVSALLTGLYGAQLVLVLRHGERHFSTYFLALFLLLQTTTVLARSITALMPGLAAANFYAPTPIQTAYLASYNFTALMLTVGFVMVATRRLQTELERRSAVDPLTGLLNRRAFATMYEREREIAARAAQPIALLLLDLDHFKSINDHYGHGVGDQVLVDFCRRVNEAIPPESPFARVGGEEFAILLPKASLAQAHAQAEVVRHAILSRLTPGLPAYTCSIGATCSNRADAALEHLMQAADEALYRAKTGGRNRVETVDDNAIARPAPPYISVVSSRG